MARQSPFHLADPGADLVNSYLSSGQRNPVDRRSIETGLEPFGLKFDAFSGQSDSQLRQGAVRSVLERHRQRTAPQTPATPTTPATPRQPVALAPTLNDAQVQAILNQRGYRVSENRIPAYARSAAQLNAYIDRQLRKRQTAPPPRMPTSAPRAPAPSTSPTPQRQPATSTPPPSTTTRRTMPSRPMGVRPV